MINAQTLTEGEGIPSDVTGPFLRLNCMEFADIPRTSALDWPSQNWEVSHACHRASQLSCLALCLSRGQPEPPHCRAPQSLAPLAALFIAVQPSLTLLMLCFVPKSTTETMQLISKNRWSVRDRRLLIFVFYRGGHWYWRYEGYMNGGISHFSPLLSPR